MGPGDYILEYTDRETGKAYRVAYDYYTDPDAIVIAWIECGGKRVRVWGDLRRRFKAAAMKAVNEAGRKAWEKLDQPTPAQ